VIVGQSMFDYWPDERRGIFDIEAKENEILE
jgi:hypothetical protein